MKFKKHVLLVFDEGLIKNTFFIKYENKIYIKFELESKITEIIVSDKTCVTQILNTMLWGVLLCFLSIHNV